MSEENKEKRGAPDLDGKPSDVVIQAPFLKKCENFFYHHKWHVIIGLVLVIALIICTVQLFEREEYDVSIMQVGRPEMTDAAKRAMRNSINGELFEGDDARQISFITRYYIDNEELLEWQKQDQTIDAGYLANASYENKKVFQMELATAEAYVCLFTVDVYDLTKKWFPLQEKEDGSTESQLYRPLSDFMDEVPEGAYDEYAVYLKDTPLYSLPGFSALSEDTLLCMRKPSNLASYHGKKKAKKTYARHEDLFARMLAYEGDSESPSGENFTEN